MGGISSIGGQELKPNRMAKKRGKTESGISQRAAQRVRLPGFLIEEDVGLGDLVKKVTYVMGIKHCGGCEKRAAALNRWITFHR
jgi:hypothetical protein